MPKWLIKPQSLQVQSEKLPWLHRFQSVANAGRWRLQLKAKIFQVKPTANSGRWRSKGNVATYDNEIVSNMLVTITVTLDYQRYDIAYLLVSYYAKTQGVLSLIRS